MSKVRDVVRAQRELRKVVEEDRFLEDWAKDFEDGYRGFLAEDLTPLEREARAREAGYRSYRISMEHVERKRLVLRRFITEPAFAKLWEILKKADAPWEGHSYSPANGGFPARALSALEDWYRIPKLTVAERKVQHQKIVKACENLLDLLEPISLSVETDNRFTSFSTLDEECYTALFGWFNSPKKWEKAHSFQKRHRAVSNLFRSGITPIWAIDYIKRMAESEFDDGGLPTKVRAKSAMKTFLVLRLWTALERSIFLGPPLSKLIPQNLFSEIVGLIADCDCSPDDVRKVLKNQLEHCP